MWRIRFFPICLLVILLGCMTADTAVAPDRHSTLQQAIDAAESGETVRVKAGVYEESLTFKDGISLVGEGRDKVTIRCDAKSGPVLSVTDCREGTISGLTLEHTGVENLPIEEEDRPDVLTLRNSSVEVVGCTVRGGAGNGLGIGGKGAPKIRDCIVQGNTGNGIAVTGKGAAPTLENNQCVENKASGIHFGKAARGTAKGNTCSKNELHGIAVEDEDTRATLPNNRCSDNKRSGVYFADKTSGTIEDCVITDNGEINEGQIARLLESEQFDTLESIASELRAKKSRFPSGVWQLKGFYGYLMDGSEEINFEKKEQFLEMLQRWHEAYPRSVTQRIVLADAHTEYAWEARGHGWASTVTEEGWRGFREHLTKAWEILKEAEKLETKDPQLYSIMVLTGMGLSKNRPGALASFLSDVTGLKLARNEIAEAFEKGVEVEPAYYHTYYRRAISLLPRWGGGPGEVELFAARAVELTRDLEGEALYAVVAHHVLHFAQTATFLERFRFSWPRIKQGHRDLLERFPESTYRLNSFCLLASVYKDKETAKELFDKIGDDWDDYVWRTQAVFDRWRNWAYDQGDWPGPRALHYVVEMGRAAMTYDLLKAGEDPNARDEYGRTPLWIAVTAKDMELVKHLLDNGADINMAPDDGRTPLCYAVQDGQLGVARFLIEKGADVNIARNGKRTPLYMAVSGNMPEMTQLLIENGADVNASTDYDWSPLMRACKNGNTNLIRMLLRHGAEVNVAGRNGWSPLMLACDNGNTEVVQALLRETPDVNQKMTNGWAALHLAARKGYAEIAKLLLEHDADLNLATVDNATPLYAAVRGNMPEMIVLLIENGADVNIPTDRGWSPLIRACRDGNAEIVRMLLRNGAEVNVATDIGWSPLMFAGNGENAEIVRLLLRNGANVRQTTSDGWNALHMAARKGYPEIVGLLLSEQGIDVNIATKQLITALHEASEWGHNEVVTLLLDKGADINPRDEKGRTPLGLAKRGQHASTVELLRKHGGVE